MTASPVNTESVRERAESWLLGRQHASGAWTLPMRADVPMPSVAMTVLAMTALRDDGDALDRGLAWLAGRQNADGSFGDGPDGGYYRPYCTALALWVLPHSSSRYAESVSGALDYLRGNQRLDGLDRGGIGFGMVAPAPTPQDPGATFTRTFAMISPTSMAAEAAHRAGLPPDDPFLSGIADYVRSCQNDPEINTRQDVLRYLVDNGFRLSGDGGIVATLENLRRARPGTVAAESVISTGISTYQGLSAYIRAGLSPGSPEVLSALRWIRSHYSVAEHAGFAEVTRAGQRPQWPTEHGGAGSPDDIGQAGRYLYLFAMAQALSSANIETIETPDGARHAWHAEIAEALSVTQRPDGCWINPNPRWLESDAVLSTAFALGTINILIRRHAACGA